MQNLLREAAQKIAAQYKITYTEALDKLNELANKDLKLAKKTEGVTDEKELSRFSEYKNFIKKAKKTIYYDLRRFHSSAKAEKELLSHFITHADAQTILELTRTHASTKEREPYITVFNDQLAMFAENSKNVLDIGGGLFPLQFPYTNFSSLKNYVWLDKDKKAFDILEVFTKTLPNITFNLHKESIGEHTWESYLPSGATEFDLALMIKLVPLIYRQERPLLRYLATVPAKRILITGSKESLTKKKSIYFRENETLKEFIKISGRKILNKLEIPNEFGYLLE